MKVRIWCYIENQGDGSAVPRFFNSKQKAEAFAKNDNERYCEDIQYRDLEFDTQGKLLNPDAK